MVGGDVATVYVGEDGEAVVEDRFVPWVAWPYRPPGTSWTPYHDQLLEGATPYPVAYLDEVNDWSVISSSRNGSCMNVVITRSLVTRDAADRDIELDKTIRFIWAVGPGEGVAYHGSKRGSGTLLVPSKSDDSSEELSVADLAGCDKNCSVIDLVASNYTIQPFHAVEMCQSFIFDETTSRLDVVAFEAAVDQVVMVKRLSLYVCQSSDAFFQNHAIPLPCGRLDNEANTSNTIYRAGCDLLLFEWVPGGQPLIFPDSVGFSVGENGVQYLLLETQYFNPNLLEGVVDQSGVRLHISDELRQYQAGVLKIGDVGRSLAPLPAGQVSERVSQCPGECTSKLFEEPINVFGATKRMHAFGRQMKTTLYREGDLSQVPVMVDRSRDWSGEVRSRSYSSTSYQVFPGDTLFTSCMMDTTKWPEVVDFGTGSLDEVCIEYLLYYPVQNPSYSTCGGFMSPELAARIGVVQVPIVELPLLTAEIQSDKAVLSRQVFTQCGQDLLVPSVEDIGLNWSIPLQDLEPAWDGQSFFEPDYFSIPPFSTPSPSPSSSMVPTVAPTPQNETESPIGTCFDSSDVWEGFQVLDPTNNFTLQWFVDDAKGELVLELSAVHDGWLSIGFSESGSMLGADLGVVTFQEGEEVIVQDMFVPWVAWPYSQQDGIFWQNATSPAAKTSPDPSPRQDQVNDWVSIGGERDFGCVSVVIARELETGDDQDRTLLVQELEHVIWAHGQGTTLSYHGASRGSTSIQFGTRANQTVSVEEAANCEGECEQVELVANNFTLPALQRSTFCQSIIVEREFAHVVAMELVLDSFVHLDSLSIYVCQEATPFFETYTEPGLCGMEDAAFSEIVPECSTVHFVWAPASKQFVMPPNVGWPFGGAHSSNFILKATFINPSSQGTVVSQAGVRYYISKTLRAHNAGLLVLGDHAATFGELPAGEISERTSECPGECTATMFVEPIRIFGSFPMMNVFGRRFKTSIYSSGEPLEKSLESVNFWSTKFKRYAVLQEHVEVLPGDSLFTSCEMDTTKWTEDVPFGNGFTEETCLEVQFYYPAAAPGFQRCGGLTSPLEHIEATLRPQLREEYYFALEEVVANDLSLQNRLALTMCGNTSTSYNQEEILPGIYLPIQRLEPAWDGDSVFPAYVGATPPNGSTNQAQTSAAAAAALPPHTPFALAFAITPFLLQHL